MMKLSEKEREALQAWADCPVGTGFGFREFARRSGVERSSIRRVVRALARKGAVKFERSLWTEDGDMMGAGYVLTDEGYKVLNP